MVKRRPTNLWLYFSPWGASEAHNDGSPQRERWTHLEQNLIKTTQSLAPLEGRLRLKRQRRHLPLRLEAARRGGGLAVLDNTAPCLGWGSFLDAAIASGGVGVFLTSPAIAIAVAVAFFPFFSFLSPFLSRAIIPRSCLSVVAATTHTVCCWRGCHGR